MESKPSKADPLKEDIRQRLCSGKNIEEIRTELIREGVPPEKAKAALSAFDWKSEWIDFKESGKLEMCEERAERSQNGPNALRHLFWFSMALFPFSGNLLGAFGATGNTVFSALIWRLYLKLAVQSEVNSIMSVITDGSAFEKLSKGASLLAIAAYFMYLLAYPPVEYYHISEFTIDGHTFQSQAIGVPHNSDLDRAYRALVIMPTFTLGSILLVMGLSNLRKIAKNISK